MCQVLPEPSVAFPQADSFARVLDLLQRMAQGPLKRNDVSTHYDIAPRQVNYYTDATRYLGLSEKFVDENGAINYRLNALGEKVMKKSARDRNMELVKLIFQHQVFREAFDKHQQQLKMPTTRQITDFMKQFGVVGLDPDKTTVGRRASTVRGWIHWILEQTRL